MPSAGAVAKILLETIQFPRPFPVRQIVSDRVGGIVEAHEPVHMTGHEVADSGSTRLLVSRYHVDQHEFGHRSGPKSVG